MEYFRSFFNWVGRVFDQLFNETILIGRKGFQRIRRMGRAERVVPITEDFVSKNSNSTDIIISVDKDNTQSSSILDINSSNVLTSMNDLAQFSRIPFDIRTLVYQYMSPSDIRNLRLINKRFNQDISSLRGIQITIDDLRPGYEWMKNTGIESLVIENFTETNRILKYPDLLMELIIKGDISPENVNYFLENCYNLKRIQIEIGFNIHSEPKLFITGFTTTPVHLKTFQIIVPITYSPYSNTVLQNVKHILAKMDRSVELVSFTFQVTLLREPEAVDNMDSYHLAALNFIKTNARSLTKINVDIKQIAIQPSAIQFGTLHRDPDFQNDDWVMTLQLTELELALDRYLEEWMPLLRAQMNLKKLELNIRGFNWTDIIPVIANNCGSTLRILTVMNIYISLRNGETRRLNLELLHDFINLEKLALRHQTHTELFSPKVSNSGQLPQSLKELSLSYFVLRPHQELEFLLKLPNLENLEFGYWSETEYSLASFLTTLSFLIKLDMTNVNSLVLTELKRKFENRNAEITRLTNINIETAKVFRHDGELETRLTIQRYS